MFDDTQEHYVENTSDKDRVILLLDVIRPELASNKYDHIILKSGMDVSGVSRCMSQIDDPMDFTLEKYTICMNSGLIR